MKYNEKLTHKEKEELILNEIANDINTIQHKLFYLTEMGEKDYRVIILNPSFKKTIFSGTFKECKNYLLSQPIENTIYKDHKKRREINFKNIISIINEIDLLEIDN